MTHFERYQSQLKGAIDRLDPAQITQAADILFDAWQRGASVWIFGNGGSWSTAEHFACDLRKWTRTQSPGVKAHALTLGPLATAYSNDHDYGEVFSRQLSDVMEDGDVAIGITCGGSRNVMAALYLAQSRGKVIALAGARWYWVNSAPADVVVFADTEDIRVQEDVHLAVCHILAEEVKQRITALAKASRIQVEPA